MFDKHRDTLFNTRQVIYPVENSVRESSEKFTKITNKYIEMFNDDKSKKLSTHSFRVAYVTSLLKHTNAQNAQQMIGHGDIRSTMKYSRYILDVARQDEILNLMFD